MSFAALKTEQSNFQRKFLRRQVNWRASRLLRWIRSISADFVQAVADPFHAEPAIDSQPTNTHEEREDVKRDASAYYRASRIRSTVFASVAGAIVTFSRMLSGNPVFGRIADSQIASLAVLLVFLLSGSLAALNWFRENHLRRHAIWLLSEEGFGYMVKGLRTKNLEQRRRPSHTRRGLAYEAVSLNRAWHKRPFIRQVKQWLVPGIPTSVAERIANIQLGELLRRGLATQEGFRGLEPKFRMEQERVKTSLDEHFWFDEL